MVQQLNNFQQNRILVSESANGSQSKKPFLGYKICKHTKEGQGNIEQLTQK